MMLDAVGRYYGALLSILFLVELCAAQEQGMSGDGHKAPGHSNAIQVDYHVDRDTVIPGWSPGVVVDLHGNERACFDSGLCKPLDGSGRKSPGAQSENEIFSPPSQRLPPGWEPAGPGEKPKLAKVPDVRDEFDPKSPSKGAIPIQPGGGSDCEDCDGPLPYDGTGDNAISQYGGGPSRDEVLQLMFSISDDDTYVIFTGLNLDLPLKTFITTTAITTNEVYGKDRKDFLSATLEGRGSAQKYDTELNILYTSKMFFYIPRTAISLVIEQGRLVYSEKFYKLLKFMNINTNVFSATDDGDGNTVYYVPVYNAIIALPNPQTPIVSQMLLTSEGYALSLLRIKRIEIDKGILVLSSNAYAEEDLKVAAEILQEYASGQLTNPFLAMEHKINPHSGEEEESEEEEEEEEESEYSSGFDSSDSSEEGSSEEGEVSMASGSDEHDFDTEAEETSKKHKKRKSPLAPRTVDAYLRQAKKWRERYAAAEKESTRRYAKKKAEKYRAAAAKLQTEIRENQILNARMGKKDTSAAASSSASRGSSQKDASWFTGTTKRNKSVKQLVSTVQSATSSSQESSVYETSTKKSIQSSFTTNAAVSIMTSHQNSEMFFSGVSAEEYSTREIKTAMMAIAMQHATFSTSGRMFKSQSYSSSGIRSARSSKRWLSKRLQRIVTTKRYVKKASQAFRRSGAASKAVASAAGKEMTAAKAAVSAYKQAAMASKAAAASSAMAKTYAAQGNSKMAKSYKKKASNQRKMAKKSTQTAQKYSAATNNFRNEKQQECKRQALMFANRINSPEQHITAGEKEDLQKNIAQILTTSQIQMLSKVLLPTQVHVLAKLLTPLQVQQTLIGMGAMSAEQMQMLLLQLQMKGMQLQRSGINIPGVNMPELPILQSAYAPIGQPAICSMQNIQQKMTGGNDMTPLDIQKYLMQGQLAVQGADQMFTPAQVEELKQQAMLQTQTIQTLIAEISNRKRELQIKMATSLATDGVSGGSPTACDPAMGYRAGLLPGPFDGLSSNSALQLAGNLSLDASKCNAIRQLTCTPQMSSYLGMDPSMLRSKVYGQTSDNDIMCLLTRAFSNSPSYSSISPSEKNLINARYANTGQRLSPVYGDSFGKLEQIILSAFNMVNNSSVKCNSPQQNTSFAQPPSCQIQPISGLMN
ncbi:hypothetical protein NEFER02_0532 [Nematocida sp. LUAm2]|nr:hypothetical protein NEFER02_0532 [Nematocida sp. LUAm2]